jgi:hypothetical protein
MEQERGWDAHSIRLSFHVVPVRLERLFIDDPGRKANCLIIPPASIHGSEEELLCLTMKLDDERKDEDELENIMGLSFHFSDAFFLHRQSIFCIVRENVNVGNTYLPKIHSNLCLLSRPPN